jgi:hypothetical protein
VTKQRSVRRCTAARPGTVRPVPAAALAETDLFRENSPQALGIVMAQLSRMTTSAHVIAMANGCA